MRNVEKQFGKLMRRLRLERDFSQEDFAGHAGLNWRFYGEIERGEASPTLHKLEALAKGLDLKLWELMKMLEKEREST